MSGTLKHKTLTGIANDDSPVGGATWDQEHVFAGGSDGQVLVRDSAQSDGGSWTRLLSTPTKPSLILRSGSVIESNDASPLVIARGSDGTSSLTFIDAYGALHTNASINIRGDVAQVGALAADDTFTPMNTAPVAGLASMLQVISDTNIGIVVRSESTVGNYAVQVLDSGNNFVFSIEKDGTLQWGASAAGATGTQSHAAMDVAIGRDGIDILALKRGTHNTKFRIYGNVTNYLQLSHDGTNTQIGGAAAGNITLGKLLNWNIDSDGLLYPETNNAYDIGISPVSHAPRNIFVAGAVCNRTKSGTPSDSDVTNAADGMLIVDTNANKIWARVGGAWKFATLS